MSQKMQTSVLLSGYQVLYEDPGNTEPAFSEKSVNKSVYTHKAHASNFVWKESSNKHFFQVLKDFCSTNMRKSQGH